MLRMRSRGKVGVAGTPGGGAVARLVANGAASVVVVALVPLFVRSARA